MSPYYRRLRKAFGNDLLLIPSVAGVIHDSESRLLLVQQHDGKWSLPAGAIEPGESPDEAVRREVREETGIICRPREILGVFGGEEFRYTYPNSDQAEYLVILYGCTVEASGPIEDTAEVKQTQFFPRQSCPPLAIPYPLDLLFAEATPQDD